MIRRVIHYHTGTVACDTGDGARAKGFFSGACAIDAHSVPLRWLCWLDFKADQVPHDKPGAAPTG